MARKYHKWAIKDLEYLRVMYVVMTRKELAQRLGVTENNIKDAMQRYKIRKPWRKEHRQWSAEELDLIRAKYHTTSSRDLAAELGVSVSTFWGTVQRHRLMKRRRRTKTEPLSQPL